MSSHSSRKQRKFPITLLSRVRVRNRFLILTGVILVLVSCAAFFIVRSFGQRKTYYVAYVGRYERHGFDRLHELALKKYLDEMNGEMRGARLELKTFNNGGDADGSRKIYEDIFADGRFVVVIDNTWGRELQSVASFIRDKKIPVIAINADNQKTDFADNAVFLGHDDDVPRIVTGFVKDALKCSDLVLINEESYALKEEYRRELEATSIKVTKLSVNSNVVDTNERNVLFQELDASLSDMRQHQHTPTVIINTHASWGVEILNYIDTRQTGVTILGGPYILNWSQSNQFSRNDNGNSLIMLTTPSDAITNKVYLDMAEIRRADSEVSQIVNAQLFVKRCLDAVSIVRGALYDESALRFRSIIARSTFTDFFQRKLKSATYTGKYDLYEFDDNLLLRNEKTFEKYFRGEVFSFPKQLNSRGRVIPNVYFGLEIINISNIDTSNRSFHADFFYWVKFDKEYSDIEKYIHFRNEKNSVKSDPLFTDSSNEQTMYKLYKKSADFTMDVDFGRYPLDTQELNIELELINPADELRISFDHESFNQSKNNVSQFNLGEWYRKDLYITVDNFIGKSLWGSSEDEGRSARKFKTLNVRMPISRRFASPFVTIMLPLIMMGLTAIAVLTVKDNSFANIGQICIGIFLSIVTYSIAFAQIAPRSSGLTIADVLFYGTFLTIFLVVLKIILFNSSIISDHARKWVNERASMIGIVALLCYGLMICLTVVIGLGLS
jgi:DNA-directed RNA polymerase delta subunit